jgi:hypothetical protein
MNDRDTIMIMGYSFTGCAFLLWYLYKKRNEFLQENEFELV